METKKFKSGLKRVRRKNTFAAVAYIIGVVVLVAALLGLVGLEIWAWVTYGGKPVSEIPAWVLVLLFK